MHHDEVHRLSVEESGDQQLVAGDEVGLARDHGAVRLGAGHREVFRVIDQGHVHATAVGGVVMHDLVIAAGYLGLGHQVLQHMAVFHFRQA